MSEEAESEEASAEEQQEDVLVDILTGEDKEADRQRGSGPADDRGAGWGVALCFRPPGNTF